MRQLNIHHLKNSLDKLCNCLDDLYNINCGGCCYIAYLIARHLDKLKIKYILVIYDYDYKDTLNINKEVTNMSKSTSVNSSVTGFNTCSHYCIFLVGGGCVNKGDVQGLRCYKISNISCKNIKWIYKNGAWNSYYNMKNNKIIKGIIDLFFKDYE